MKMTPEIVLLDLRLHASTDLDRELARKLLCVIKELPQNGLAWPEIKEKEVKRIKEWCKEKSNDDQAAVEALSLLPRLLAMALPLTPIILFSATGQARIKEILKPYQNIFTGFEKPRVLSNPESVKNSIAALHEGLDKALKMMRLRLQLAHAQKAVKIAEDGKCQNGIESHHIEIYADETGTVQDGIASGVAFCVFPSAEKAEALQEKLKEYNDNPDSNDTNDKGIGINRDEGKFELKKANDADACRVQTLASLLGNVGIRDRQSWSVVRTKMSSVQIGGSADVSLGTFPDSPLDSALRFNLEFSLFVLIPYLLSNSVREVSIYLPTRDVGLDNRELPEQLAGAFDLLVPYYNNYMIRTWPFGSAFPIVRGWLQEWGDGGSPAYNKIKKIKMTTLGDQDNKIKRRDKNGNYYGETDYDCETGKYPRLFHGIADWVCKVTPGEQPRDSLECHNLFPSPNWFVSKEDTTEDGRILMQALKASVLRSGNDSNDRDSDALRLVLQNSYIAECKEELLYVDDESCSQQRLILWALRKELDDARGQSLHLLCA